MAIKIRGIPYDQLSRQDDSKINEDTFSSNTPFMIICNKPIPKNYKTYMEFTITEHPSNSAYRHIPLYVGVHKEPSFGVLNSDFVIGTIYYTLSNMNYDVMERYNAAGEPTHQQVDKTHAKIPILNTIIGIGVDIPNNIINIYSDGNLFYSFSPSTFDLSKENEDFYFVIYSKFNERIKGNVNYGRYTNKYMPDGYWNLYQFYYTHGEAYQEISSSITVPGIIYDKYSFSEIESKINPKNDIAPLEEDNKKHIRWIYKNDSTKYENDRSFKFTYHPGTIPEIRDIVTTNLPIPVDTKVYLEFNIKECEMYQEYTGIPIEIGITDKQNELSNAFGIDLCHKRYIRYKLHSYIREDIKEYDMRPILNPVTPTQPNRVGVIIDLSNNNITILTDNSILSVIKFKDVSFNNPTGIYYFFIRAISSEAYRYDYYGICNFGEDKDDIDFDIPEDTKTLFSYYNDPIKFPIDSVFINCRINVRAYKTWFNKFVYCTFSVAESPNSDAAKFSPGLNKLWNAYNTISDTEEKHNVPDIPPYDLDDIIKDDEKENDRRVWVWYDIISKVFVAEGQHIPFSTDLLLGNVIGKEYSVYDNSNLLEGRITGVSNRLFEKILLSAELYYKQIQYINNEDGRGSISDNVNLNDYIKWNNNENGKGVISGTVSAISNYTVTIIQSPNQTITVHCNGKDYTETFEALVGSTYTATITPAEGYNAGKLSSTSGTIKSNVTISATAATIKTFTVTITQSANQTITVNAGGSNHTSTFTANWGTTCTTYTATISVSNPTYYTPGTLSSTSGTIKSNITISATAATLKKYTITVTQPANGRIEVNSQVGTSFTYNAGTKVTVQAFANSGYKVTALYVDKVTKAISANLIKEEI